MNIKGIICPVCKDFIYSRANHDFHYCNCKSTAVDGGYYDKIKDVLSYNRVIGNTLHDIISSQIELNISYSELFNDWNKGKDIYGIMIKEEFELKRIYENTN